MQNELISVRLPKEFIHIIEELSRIEKTDKSSIIRKSMELGLREYRIEIALRKLMNGEVSLWKAAEIAGVDYREMLIIIRKRGIVFPMKLEDIRDEFKDSI